MNNTAAQYHGISSAARNVPCAEGTLRSLERRGVIAPVRDTAGRRLFSEADLIAAREFLNRSPQREVA
jgi:DNA-binding transcriptional MerR regulator